ncbi:MAG: Rne/Rng family ribonuclease [Chlamydiota bacterium]
MDEILLNIESKEIRYAYLKNGKLEDLIIERKKCRQLTGNIYRGKATNILHNIQSAFIDINEGENGFIHISDILENRRKFEEMFDMDFDLDVTEENPKDNPKNIEQILKIDQPVLVQVVKEPIGTKGARLTSNISIAGRYLVLLPNTPHRGVSKKIEDKNLRDRLKKIIRSFEMPKDMGLICRTASSYATTDMLIEEATELLKSWEMIVEKFHSTNDVMCLYEESNLIKRSVLTALDKKYERILIDDYPTFQHCRNLYLKYGEEHPLKIEFYRDKNPMFERFNVEKEIDRALKRKIWLGCGGYLFFDKTEAMYTIDVNSGRSHQNEFSSNLEETLVRINLEAAEEIARQFKIRNIGGLIICDFIDMRSTKNQRRVLEHLKDCMRDDSAKCTILGMSEFGLVEMTRQRNRESLWQTMYFACPYCSGNGMIKTHETLSIDLERDLKKLFQTHKEETIQITLHPEFLKFLSQNGDLEYWENLAKKIKSSIEIESKDTLHINEYQIKLSDGQKIES